ncbi:MAG: Phosphopantetheinyl transferase component of siderophore synthetase [Rhodobacteraceae bacterium HLUCCA12]|nr:MAG: Phosphopantetheinyl transferase component of siderophore synthetase [Rhodobacteraceae bacterium HLUCCA12]
MEGKLLTKKDYSDFSRLVRALYPCHVAVGAADPGVATGSHMFHVEQMAVANAVPARQREFLAGRRAAAEAQRGLGYRAAPILMGDDRAPSWPKGLRGSISHAAGHCLAVVSDDPSVAALGIDIEERAPLPDEAAEAVLLPQERAWLSKEPESPVLARLIFSAKECAFKAQYPLTGQLFAFDIIEIQLDMPRNRFAACFRRPVGRFSQGASLEGRFLILPDLMVTAIAIPV